MHELVFALFRIVLFRIWEESWPSARVVFYMSLVTRKHVFGGFEHVILRPACSATETS